MKKMFIAMAVCAGLLTFASADFVKAADQQAAEAVSLVPSTAVDADTQQLSTRRHDDEC